MNLLRLVRTSTFQLAWSYMGVFGGSALLLMGYVYWAMAGHLEQQTNATIAAEITGLVEQYRERGSAQLEVVIRQRAAASDSRGTLYLFTDARLRRLAGNIDAWPEGTLTADGWYDFKRVDEQQREVPVRGQVFVLSDGRRLLVAQDKQRLEATRALINQAFMWALLIGIALSLLGGFLMSATVLRRIESINTTSRDIMSGRLKQRMPVRGINDEFDQLASNLNAMLDRIDQLVDGVRAVADNIAHDLRTPLTRLRARLETLAARPDLRGETHDELNAALADADQMLATFRALLRIARLESGGLERAWADIDLGVLLQDAWELYQAVGEDKDMHVRLEPCTGHLRGDRDLLFQAIANLLDNAIKYSPPGSEISLSMQSHDGWIDINVGDRGPGVPPAERDKVMQRFYRTDSVTGIPGSGLGLSLVNAIARHHGGIVLLTDNQPGLQATLRLPENAGSAAAAGATTPAYDREQVLAG